MKTAHLLIPLLSLSIVTICFTACKQNTKETSKDTTENSRERKPPEFKYDDLGRIIQRKDFSYNRDGSVRYKNQYDYKYDKRGNRIEEITQSWDLSGKRVVYTVARYTFNEFNLKTEAIFQSFDTEGREILWVKNVYDYDKNGYEIRDQQFDKQGHPLSLVTRKRDEKGRILEETSTIFNPDGSIKELKGAQYDINGKILKTW